MKTKLLILFVNLFGAVFSFPLQCQDEFIDTKHPIPYWKMDCSGNVNFDSVRYVYDMPLDSNSRSNMATIDFRKLFPPNNQNPTNYNYELIVDDFNPCEVEKASWRLRVKDKSDSAYAWVTFTDCAGNDSSILIKYYPPKILFANVKDNKVNFGKVRTQTSKIKTFNLVNYSDSLPIIIKYVKLLKEEKYGSSEFSIWDTSNQKQLKLPVTLKPHDTLKINVKFTSSIEKIFTDTLGYGNDCFFWWKASLKADVKAPMISFPDKLDCISEIGKSQRFIINIRNNGTDTLRIIRVFPPKLTQKNTHFKIFYSKAIEDNSYITYIYPNSYIPFSVEFTPDDTITYLDTIRVLSNILPIPEGDLYKIDSICILSGQGLQVVDVEEEKIEETILYPNPTNSTINLIFELNTPTDLNFNLYDMTGTLVSNLKSEFYDAGLINENLILGNLANGIYYLKIESLQFNKTYKLIINK